MRGHNADQTLEKMRAKYGEFMDKNPMMELRPANIPEPLGAYAPYAALWGVLDDLEREQRIADAPEAAKADLLSVFESINGQLDDWLAGAEATSHAPSREYLAFSAMRMAADFI